MVISYVVLRAPHLYGCAVGGVVSAFSKASIEAMDESCMRGEEFIEGANWAHEWTLDEHHSFALYRYMKESKLDLKSRVDKLITALEHYGLGCQVIGFDHGDIAREALNEYGSGK